MKGSKKTLVIIIAVLVLAAVCVGVVVFDNDQSLNAIPMPISFSGEYSFDNETWHPYNEQIKFSALSGDLYLKGHFDLDMYENSAVGYFSDHISSTVSVGGEIIYMDIVSQIEDLGIEPSPSFCVRNWSSWVFPEGLKTTDEIFIHLSNPHIYGNDGAYNTLLSTLCSIPVMSDVLEQNLRPYGDPQRLVGFIMLIIAFIIIGASIVTVITRSKASGLLWKCGFLAAFAGGFITLDTVDISLVQDIYVFNTYATQICAMLFSLMLGACMLERLKGKAARTAEVFVLVLACIDAVLITLSFTGVTLLYDMLPWWTAAQLPVSCALIVCGIIGAVKANKNARMFLVFVAVLNATLIVDMLGVGATIYSRANFTKTAFICCFIVYIIKVVLGLISNHQASVRAAKLEKELEDSRISIMLSQIQPHFLYNTLSTIRELCHKDPKLAEDATVRFSEFLRKNMDSLSIEKPIPFESELMHARNYLELEQLRFGDQLSVKFDIETSDFRLPTLALQPLVENAVRHGVRKKEGGGEVVISTREFEDRFEVCVCDDGAGFDMNAPLSDNRSHVGIKNVRERLQRQCSGDLVIESAIGKGTTARITVKKEKQ